MLGFIEFAHLYFSNFQYCLNRTVCVNILWYVLYGNYITCLLRKPFRYSHLYLQDILIPFSILLPIPNLIVWLAGNIFNNMF